MKVLAPAAAAPTQAAKPAVSPPAAAQPFIGLLKYFVYVFGFRGQPDLDPAARERLGIQLHGYRILTISENYAGAHKGQCAGLLY